MNIKNLIFIFIILCSGFLYAENDLYFSINYDNSGQWGFNKALAYKIDYEINNESLLFTAGAKYYSGKKILPDSGYYANAGGYLYKKIEENILLGGGGYYSYHHTDRWSKNLYLVGASIGYIVGEQDDARITVNVLQGNIIKSGIEINMTMDIKMIRILTEIGFYNQGAFIGKRCAIGVGIKIF